MIEFSDAIFIARKYVDSIQKDMEGVSLVVLEKETISKSFGWVFFYNTQQFQLSGDYNDMLFGNAPFIVDRMSGKITETGTAYPVEYYIERYDLNNS
jgi:hypothetical protein